MFEMDNEKIGAYVSNLIERKFNSARKFGAEYLEKSSGKKATEEKIQNMANRLSQIKNGKNSIQIYDLPIFSKLLGVSIEQILSAGECDEPKNDSRMTNYTVAQSHSKQEWILYIEREDKPILNPDEYGKTVLDYAIEFGNYDFLKFLLDENYIWFDSRKDNDYVMTFGAGTSIQRIKFEEQYNGVFIRKPDMDDLQYKLATEDQLRMYIISLAADHNDLKMLEKLRAREIPELYYCVHYASCYGLDIDAHYDKNMVSHIARSGNKVLNYYTDPFEVRDRVKYRDGVKRNYRFIFPYISQLLDMLIKNNSPFLEVALEKSIAYNEETLKKLKALIKSVLENSDPSIIWDGRGRLDMDFYENGSIIRFRGIYAGEGIVTNVIHAVRKSKNEQINSLIEKLNKSYDEIRNIVKEDSAHGN